MKRPTRRAANGSSATRYTTQGGKLCPVCGGVPRPTADVGAFDLFACDDCGCWSSDALARGARTSFVPSGYFAKPSADLPRWKKLLKRLRRESAAPASVLDVGCGTGAFIRWFGERVPAAALAGVELDPERAAQAQAANPQARIFTGDAAETLEGLRDRYDLITMWDVLEHVADPARLIIAAAARLAPGGTLFLQTIHEHSLVPRLGRLSHVLTGGHFVGGIRRTHDAHHLVFFSRGGLARLAVAAGLTVRHVGYDRLTLSRMDGHPMLTVPTAALMAAEKLWGNGVFLSVTLQSAASAPRGAPPYP